jgi:hypothetical protein
MATTFVEHTGDGNATKQFSFPSYQESDVKVRVDGVLKTTSTHYNITSYTTTGGGNVVFTSGNIPLSGTIRIYRDTSVDAAKAVFTPGSSVKAADLNNNITQLLYRAQEEQVPNLIQSYDIEPSAIETSNIKNDSVNADKIADDVINSEHYVAGSIDHEHLANDIIDGDNIQDDVINSEHYVAASIDHEHLANDIIDGDNIQDDVINSEHYVDGSIDHVHLSNDCIDADNIQDNAVGSEHIQADAVTDSEIVTGTLDNRYYTETELNNGQLDNQYYTETELDNGQLDNRYFTETELSNGALDGRYYTETEAEDRFLRQDSSETIASGQTWSNSDAFVATTAAINARIIDLIDEVGGFTAIANETSFPTTNPQGATGQAAILSIAATTATLTPSGTTVTIPNGAGTGNTVTITGVPTAIPQNFGFLVESTSTLHTYSFHRLVPIATQVNTVAQNITNIVQAGVNVADINNFADIYIISSSEPTTRNDGSSLQEGDLWFDSSNDNLQVYTGSAFSIITPSQAVLDDVAIVSGAITYSEDLGLITNAVSTGSSNGSLDIVADALEDEITFTVTAATGKFIIDGVDKPALTLYKGWTYTFDVSDNSNANHPLRFSSGGSAYNTGVTVTGTQGQAGAKVQLVVPESQPTSFIYYCTNHSGMGNSITVKDDPIKTVSDNITNINTVASDLTEGTSEIDTVANNITNVNNVGNNISNVNSVHSNAANINSAVSNASNINSVAGSIANVNTVASNLSNVNSFANTYRIASSAPTSSLDQGDLYFDTTSNELRVYNGSSWQGGVTATGNLASLGANTFTGNQTINANIIISGTVDGKDVSTLIANLVEDTSPQLGGALDGQNNNMSNIGTIDGANLQLDFGTI